MPKEPSVEKENLIETTYTPKQWKYAQGTGEVMLMSIEEAGIQELEIPNTLPVLRDVFGLEPSIDGKVLKSEMEMRDHLAYYEEILQWSNPIEKRFFCDKGSFCEKGNLVQLIKTYDQGKSSIDDSGRIMIEFIPGTKQPYTSIQEYEASLEVLIEKYAKMFPTDTSHTTFCERNFDQEYHCTSSLIEKKDSVEEELIAYVEKSYQLASFGTSDFFSDNVKEIEKLEDYSIKSVQQAEAELRKGNYYKAGGPIDITKDQEVVLWELRYMEPKGEYLYPFYIFYLDLHKLTNDVPTYQIVYVPAMMDADLIQYQDENGELK